MVQGLRHHLRKLLGGLSSERLHIRGPARHTADPPHCTAPEELPHRRGSHVTPLSSMQADDAHMYMYTITVHVVP